MHGYRRLPEVAQPLRELHYCGLSSAGRLCRLCLQQVLSYKQVQIAGTGCYHLLVPLEDNPTTPKTPVHANAAAVMMVVGIVEGWANGLQSSVPSSDHRRASFRQLVLLALDPALPGLTLLPARKSERGR